MNRDVARQWITMLTIIALIVMNVLANALPLNGISTATISDSFKVYFVPAGYVFAIWGLIYVGLLAYGIYQALPDELQEKVEEFIRLLRHGLENHRLGGATA